ncbi:MAG: peptidylprolyl isomerase [Firmicutes bacterium]|nr:peptidylprolyl isomerase [Bacillota bacterium]
MIKRITSIFLMVVLGVFMMTGCGDSASENDRKDGGNSSKTEENQPQNLMGSGVKEFSAEELLSGKHHVEMDIEGKGTIKLELDADQAPISVTNFINLTKDGFYNGLSFHRVLAGSLIQGGSPTYDAMGGVDYTIKGEFTLNGVNNTLSHTRGAISMARTNDYNGGGCQFFIMASDFAGYDGQYAVFGYVTEGMEIVDDICNNTPTQDRNGMVARADQPIISEVRAID